MNSEIQVEQKPESNSIPTDKIAKIAVVDVETTSLEPWDGCIVEIGICLLDLNDGSIEKVMDKIVKGKTWNAGRMEDAWIFENSNLTPEKVDTLGVRIDEIKAEIEDILKKYRFTAYNREFDLKFLRAEGIEIPYENLLPDPMLVATPVVGILRRVLYTCNEAEYKWPTVNECRAHLCMMPGREPHRAYLDAVLEAKIIYELYQLGHYHDNRILKYVQHEKFCPDCKKIWSPLKYSERLVLKNMPHPDSTNLPREKCPKCQK